METLSSPAFLSPMQGRAMQSLEEEEAAEAQLERELTNTASRAVAAGTIDATAMQVAIRSADGASDAQQEQITSLGATLKQLENEPHDDAACAAKFELYEAFAKLTESARAATLDLWAQSQGEFDGATAVKSAIQREIARVDRPDHLAIQDQSRFWFVHDMCKGAARNQQILNGVLAGITTKLQLLGSQTECPICLEQFSEGSRPPTTLSCAHKACQECWGHWVAVNSRRTAVCPLCRHEEFLDGVLRAASAVPPPDVSD